MTRQQYLLRHIFIYGLFILGIMIGSIFTYHATGKVINWVSSEGAESLTYQELVVQRGDTLWELAERSNLNMDTRYVVHRIMEQNSLKKTIIQPGQVIFIPVKQSKQPITSEIATSQTK